MKRHLRNMWKVISIRFMVFTFVTVTIGPTYVFSQTPKLIFLGDKDHDVSINEYKQIWDYEGERIISSMTNNSGLKFEVDTIFIQILEKPSYANYDTITLRASYPIPTKKATLVHELGHELTWNLIPENAEPGTAPTPHYILFLFLFDTWVDLWGEEFAWDQVKVESSRKGLFNYKELWNYILSLSLDERRKELNRIVNLYSKK